MEEMDSNKELEIADMDSNKELEVADVEMSDRDPERNLDLTKSSMDVANLNNLVRDAVPLLSLIQHMSDTTQPRYRLTK